MARAEHPRSESGFEATIAIASAEGMALAERPSSSSSAAGPGARVDRYLIVDELGRGGMGVVYAAYDPQLDRKVAIKVISVAALCAGAAADPEAQTRLLREAQAMARLLHPNVVAVHDVGHTDRDVFIAMEMVHGRTLRAWLAEAPRSVRAIVDVFIEAGRGLEAAHAAGLVHRDFKPDNVLIDQRGAVKIADFGLARRASADEEARAQEATPTLELEREVAGEPLTRTGTILGTPAYMAPEQHLSLAADARSDQYSFCVALFEALYGYRPFTGATLIELRAHVLAGKIEAPPASAEAPRWLLPIISRGLAPDPGARWPSMHALLEALGRDPGRARRRWLIAGGIAATIAAVTIGGLERRSAQAAAELERCRAPEAEVAALISEERRDAVRRSVLATRAPLADRSAKIIDDALAGFAAAWIDGHAESCAASITRGALAPEIMALRERCAARQRLQVAATLDLLVDADATTVEHMGQIADRLPRPRRCDDLRFLVHLDGGVGPREAPEVAAIQGEITRAYAEANAGRYEEAEARVMPLLARAEAVGDRRLLAELRETAGRLKADLGDFDAAEELYLSGLSDALATDFVTTAAEIASSLMYLDGILRGRVVEGRRWGRVAEGLIAREEDDDLRMQYLNYLGALSSQSGAHEEGLRAYDQALEIADRVGIARQDRASLLNNRGILLAYLGRSDEAIAAHHEALAILRGIVGDEHPDVALTLNGLGLTYLLSGDLEAAIAAYREALVIQERLLGADGAILALTLLNLGNAELEAGHGAEAKVHGARALALLDANFPADHLYYGYVMTLVGDAAFRVDHDLEAGEAGCARGLEILEATLEPEHVHLAYPLTCLGELALARGDAAAARPLLERALRSHGAAGDVAIGDRGNVRFALARALEAAGEREAARARAAEALTYYAAAGPAYAERAATLQRWEAGLGAAP